MRAVRIHEFGGPEQCRLEEVEARVPGFGEVAVRVRATSLNYRDLMVLKGAYNPRIKFPFVPLSDGAGEVISLGAGVGRFRVGDRVAAAFMPGWISGPPSESASASALGGGGKGMLSEVVVLPEEGLVAIPEHLTFEEAATLPCAGVTAWNALVEEGGIQPGQTVLIQGTGGVSLFALQIAKAAGATVFATSGSDDKLARVLELGAADGVNYKTNPEWDKQVRDWTGGEGVDHVVEVGGAGTLARSLRVLKIGGRLSLIGVLSGVVSDLNITPILMRSIRVQGIYVGSQSMFERFNRAISAHRIHPVIDRVFELEEVADALRHMESGAHFGKIVIRL